ncbi:MAG TPA: sigma-70 family RNA polymerase sigma factor [Vicinamibacterales bacterium]|nr:sigma-70 family RNA polymerase sigma factor [Vicinamibacterales bacterium]
MDQARLQRLRDKAQADRWNVPPEVFSNALERSAEKAFTGRTPSEPELDRYYDALHLSDLALACACAMGREDAWDHFVREFRPGMYRAADAIDAGGGARDIAQSLYAELFGLKEKDGIRQSVFRYFHGRSSLATWLRSLISQRFIDRHRETRKLDPLPDESSAEPLRASASRIDPDRARFVAAMRAALAAAIAALDSRDRLRLACYYAQEMTLAQIGRLTREHEATVSRQLAKARKTIREDVERRLGDEQGFSKVEIEECFASIVDDAGNLDLDEWLGDSSRRNFGEGGRKKSALDRSISKELL